MTEQISTMLGKAKVNQNELVSGSEITFGS